MKGITYRRGGIYDKKVWHWYLDYLIVERKPYPFGVKVRDNKVRVPCFPHIVICEHACYSPLVRTYVLPDP